MTLRDRFYLSFQAKVIIPVVIFLILILAIIAWLVNGRITDQFEEETRQTLTTAEAVFRNSLEIRLRNLMLRYQGVANEPRFKAVALLADSKTMTAQVRELLQEIGGESKVMIFTTADNVLLAASKSDPNIDIDQFYKGSLRTINEASRGRAAADTLTSRTHLLNAISVPVVVNDAFAGALTIGQAIGPSSAQELKLLTRSEIVLLVSGKVILSTINVSHFDQQFVSTFENLKSLSAKRMQAVAVGQEHYLCLAGNFPGSSGGIGYLLFSSYEKALQKKRETQRALLIISLAGIVSSSLLLWALIRKITRPLRQLRDSAEAVGRGDFSRRVEVDSRDECGELAVVFNRMTENLKTSQAEVQQAMQSLKDTQAQLIETEKLSAMGKFVAGIAHELNNPLTGVIGFSQMLQESGIDEKQEGFLNRIIGSAERCRKVVQSLLSFSRRHRPQRTHVNINDLLESSLEILQHEFSSSQIEIRKEFDPQIPLTRMDAHQMQQVFLNILMNAVQAIENSSKVGTLLLSTKLVGERIFIVFRDDGPGIAEEDLQNVFSPFFTTKPIGEGTGLGLSLSYGIVREHGGNISVQSKPGEGATFTVELPRVEAQAEDHGGDRKVASDVSLRSAGRSKRILVIDDEESILELIRESIASSGYHVDTVGNGNAALTMAKQYSYDLVVCDWKMPGIGGQKIYEQLRLTSPRNIEHFLFITGDVLSEHAEQFLRTESRMCLLKPFSVDEFRATIKKVLRD